MKHPQTIGGICCHYIVLKMSSTKLCSIGTCYLDSYHMGKDTIMAAEAVVFRFSPKKTSALSVSITIYVNLVNSPFTTPFHFMKQSCYLSCSGTAEWMAKCYSTTIRVQFM